MKSEMKMPRDRDREVKFPKKYREFSRNETLAGYCFDIFEDDQLDDGESLHRDITIILFVDIMHTLWCLPHERIRFWAK